MAVKGKKDLEYKKITFDEMKTFIETKHPDDKAWFKSVALDENGVYQHLVARNEFFKKYMPDKIPVAKQKVTKADMLQDW